MTCPHECVCLCHHSEDMVHISACCDGKCEICGLYIENGLMSTHLNQCHGLALNYLQAKEKFEKLGRFGVTAQDHCDLGSTPPKILADNPGKTKADLYTEEEIEKELLEMIQAQKNFSDEKHRTNNFAQSFLRSITKEIIISFKYLESLNRLPETLKKTDGIK